MNRVLSHLTMVTKTVNLSYSDTSQNVTVHMTHDTVFKTGVRNMFGFHADGVTSPGEGCKTMERDSTSVIDMAQGFYSLFVYTNVVESRVFGECVVMFLRIVPIKGKHGDVVSKSFDNIQYIPVLHKEFATIEIDIRDDTGRRVLFESGRVTVTLHFR